MISVKSPEGENTLLHVIGKRGMMRGRAELGFAFKEHKVVNDGDCVAIFHSIHRVMKAEKILKAEQLKVLLIPVPRQLSSDCGLAIRFSLSSRDALEKALDAAGLAVSEIWQKQDGVFSQLL